MMKMVGKKSKKRGTKDAVINRRGRKKPRKLQGHHLNSKKKVQIHEVVETSKAKRT